MHGAMHGSRLQAPSIRTAPAPTKRGPGGATGGPALPPAAAAFGFRRPSSTTSSVASSTTSSSAARRRASEESGRATALPPPRLALHELQATPAATFLKRGNGKTIATLGNPGVAALAPSTQMPRRKSGSPQFRPRGASREAVERHETSQTPTAVETTAQLMNGHREPATATQNEWGAPRRSDEPHQTPLSPETMLRQRKRSADMMDPCETMSAMTQQQSPVKANGAATEEKIPFPEEVDEPPVPTAVAAPMTPPPRESIGHHNGDLLPVSPRDSKRMKRLARSPKTPLGISTYAAEEGGLSATQRVRLSLSGYMTVAGLTSGLGSSKNRDSGVGSADAGDEQAQSGGAVSNQLTVSKPAPRSAPTSFDQSMSSLARSKFAASRSMSGPAQIASALLPTKQSVDCLMGYIRELQRSEATTRIQLERIKKVRHEELSQSRVRETTLESTLMQVESERERERKMLEENQRMVEKLKQQIALLEQQQTQQEYEGEVSGSGEPYYQTTGEGEVYQNDYAEQNGGQYAEEWTEAQGDQEPIVGHVVEPPASQPTSLPSATSAAELDQPIQSSSGDHEQYPPTPQASEWDGQNVATDGNAYDQNGSYQYHDRQGSNDEAANTSVSGEWIDQNGAYYQSEYYDELNPPLQPAEGYQDAGYNAADGQYYQYEVEPSNEPTNENAQQPDWSRQSAQYDEEEYYHDHDEAAPSYATTALAPVQLPPPSPMASPDPRWRQQNGAGVQSQMGGAPPPMFRVAPRLSDIISPLSRSNVAPSAATDHNVLRPVMPQALSNLKSTRDEKPQPVSDRAFMMTPPRHGPPAFSMSSFEPNPSTFPTSAPARPGSVPSENPQYLDNSHLPVEEHVEGRGEQFVPAELVFKPFHTATTPVRKVTTSKPSGPSSVTAQAMKDLLTEFFTAVDKGKLRMVEGYTRRYKGEEAKLFTDLTKRYGVQRVSELKLKFEEAANALSSGTVPQTVVDPISASSALKFIPQGPAVELPDVAPPRDATLQFHEATGPRSVDDRSSSLQLAPEESSFGQTTHQLDPVQFELPPTPNVTSPPPLATPPPAKVSPKTHRRGPPLPFAFDDVQESAKTMAPDNLPPPPVVSVSAPPTMQARPPPPPSSPPRFDQNGPPRMAPSPPRVPPPKGRDRSPVRNGSVLRQRVSPQQYQLKPDLRSGPPNAPPQFPPRPLSTDILSSSPPTSKGGGTSPVQPVSLESLLNDFYRKHQPDRLKNVPEVVKEYRGKERELISLLKKKYGALSIKRLEQNLATLEEQSASISAAAHQPSKKSVPKKRGCLARIGIFLVKILVIRLVVMLAVFGGLIALDRSVCHQGVEQIAEDDVIVCDSLKAAMDSFEFSRLTEYAFRVESKSCFCEQWKTREAALLDEPSLKTVADLIKLSPFSRTIAEPVVLEAADKYLPDLPYREYYESYARPAFQTCKHYAIEGYEQVKLAYKEAEVRAVELPWGEYYEVHAKPTVELGREYALLGLEYAEQAYRDAASVVAEQWAQIVEMYNEEGTELVSTYDSIPENDSSMPSPVDALTKVAKASKSLAEVHEIDAVEVESATSDSESVALEDHASPEEVVPADHTVEVIVEQSGFDVTHAGGVDVEEEPNHSVSNRGSEEAAVEHDALVEVDEVIVEEVGTVEHYDGASSSAGVVVEESDAILLDREATVVYKEGVDTAENENVDAAVNDRTSFEASNDDPMTTKTEENNHGDYAGDVVTFNEDFIGEEASVNVELETIASEVAEPVDEEMATEASNEFDVAIAAEATGVDSVSVDEDTSRQEAVEDIIEETPISPEIEDVLIEMTEPAQEVANGESHNEDAVETAVDVSMDAESTVVADEVAAPDDTTETELQHHGQVASVSEEISVVASASPAESAGFQEQDEITSRDGENHSNEDSETIEGVETILKVGDQTDAEHPVIMDDELAFVEELSGLDPSQLLDLADLAAAELYTVN